MSKTKRYLVRYWNPNGDNIFMQRLFTPLWAKILFVFWPMARRWDNWLLLNNDLYIREAKISKKVDEIIALYKECKEIEAQLKRDKKEINASTKSTAGTSAPFPVDLTDSEIRDRSVFMERPDGKWRSYLNLKKFPGLKGPDEPDFREEMGVTGKPREKATAYTLKEFEALNLAIEDSDSNISSVVTYKEPQPQRKKKRRNTNNNQNNQNRNNNDDDYEDDDDE
jgi:hypothetical protein